MKYFIDFDDTLVFSKEAVVKILNKMFSMNKSIENVSKWDFSDLHSEINTKLIKEIFESDEFWDNVEINEYAISVLNSKDVYVCSCGTPINLQKKEKFIRNNFPKFKMLFVENGNDKKIFDMKNGIQVDDATDFLIGTNAKYKILLKNNIDVEWNYVPINSDIYVANDWYDVEKIIDWWEYVDDKCKKFS